jgi:hypothetical protein
MTELAAPGSDCKRCRPFYRDRLNEFADGTDNRIGFRECAVRIRRA